MKNFQGLKISDKTEDRKMEEEKTTWKTFVRAAFILFLIYFFVKDVVDPTPCYPGEVVEAYDGRRASVCQTTMEEYDVWAKKHMSYDKYLKWRNTEFFEDDE